MVDDALSGLSKHPLVITITTTTITTTHLCMVVMVFLFPFFFYFFLLLWFISLSPPHLHVFSCVVPLFLSSYS